MPQMQDEAGNIWEVDAQGNPVRLVQSTEQQPGIQTQAPDPGYQYEGQIAGNKAAASDYDPQIRMLEAQNKALELEIKRRAEDRAQAEFEATGGKPTAIFQEDQKRDGKGKKANVIRTLSGELKQQFEDNIKGQPASRIWGATEYIDDLPANDTFKSSGEQLLGLIRPLIATGAKDGDSDKEMEIFKSYVPSNDDTDMNIERKLKALDVLVGGVIDGKSPSELQQIIEAPESDQLPKPQLSTTNQTQQQIVGGNGGSVTATSGEFETVDDPALAGVNDQVYNMLVGGKSAAEIGSYLESRGVNPIPMMGAIQKNVELQKTNPGIRPTINVDDMQKEVPWARQQSSKLLNSNVGAAGVGYGNAMTAGYLDEAVDALGGENTQQTKEYLRDNYAVASGVGELTGAVLGMKGGGALLKKAPMLANLGNKGAVAGDVAYGAAYGSGESNDDRLTGAAVGGVSTLVGNQLGQRVFAPLGRKAMETAPVQAGANAARSVLKKAPIKAPQKPEKAVQMVTGQAGEESIQSLAEAQEFGLPMALADTNPKLRTLAGSAVRKSPAAREFAESVIEPRAAGQAERASQAVEDYLQPVGDITAQQENLIRQARSQAGPLYDETYAAPGAGAAFESIEPLLQRPTMRDAMQRGQRIAGDEGIDPNSLGYNFNEAGDVVYEQAPSWQSYDYTKRGLDDVIQANNNPMTGGLNSQGRSAQQIKAKLLEIIDQRNPSYKAAREAYSGPVSIKGAIDQGRKSGNMKPDIMVGQMRGMNEPRQQGFRTGYAASMDDRINNAQMTGNPYKRVYGTPNQQANVNQLFPDGAPQFARQAELEDQMTKTAYETLGGSPTAARAASDGLFDEGSVVGNAAEVAFGIGTGMPPVNTMMQGVKNFGRDGVRLGLGKRSEQRAEAIAPILLDTNPQAGIDFMNNALAQRAAYDAWKRQAMGVGGDIGAGAGVLATAPLVAN